MLRSLKYILQPLSFFCFIIIFNTSCKKYLDDKPDKNLVVPHTLADLQGLLDDNGFMNNTPSGYAEISSDDYFVRNDDYNSFIENGQKAYTWKQIVQFDGQNDWQMGYYTVYNSNYILEQIDHVERTVQNASAWNNVKGSALFYRAYIFLNLAWTYANAYDATTAGTDLAIVLKMSSDFNVKSVRSTVKETYDRVILDAKEAISFLPDVPQHPMRPSLPAAYGLLARTYLSMRNYDSAFRYANLALTMKHDLLDYNSADVDVTAFAPYAPFNKEIIFFSLMGASYQSMSPDNAMIDTTLFNSYNSNDLRKAAYFTPNGDYFSFKGNYNSKDYTTFFSGIATDELFLIRAECNTRLGKTTDALTDLNHLLVTRWASGTFSPVTASSAAEALNIILQERRKELLMRGLRWSDIKRFNKEGANITLRRFVNGQTFTLAPNSGKFALAIPNDIIILTGIQQNPL